MKRHEEFLWRGETIADVEAWAAARGQRMVNYHAIRSVVDQATQTVRIEQYYGRMPESFWNNLHITDGWEYHEVTKIP